MKVETVAKKMAEAVKDEESHRRTLFPDQFRTALLVLAPGLAEGLG